jgi:protein-disulfide isomerase
MFANRNDLSRPSITKLATQAGLDMKRFAADWASKETQAVVAHDIQDGDKAGVEGTPTVFVNGKHYHGSLAPAVLRGVIEAELKKK